jgi:hypothetical protein
MDETPISRGFRSRRQEHNQKNRVPPGQYVTTDFFDDLFKTVGLAESPAPYIMAHCDGGYTTNIPVADLIGGKGMIATRYEGLPIPPVHGGPARLLVPHLYFRRDRKRSRTVTAVKSLGAKCSRLLAFCKPSPAGETVHAV